MNDADKQIEGKTQVGMVGMFDDADDLIHAAEIVRDSGFRKWDCHTPYPVHGLDAAMGIRESGIPYLTLSAGFTGIAVALGMQWWMSAVDYKVRIGGKAFFSWPAFVPVTFEWFVLFSCLTTMASVIIFCKLGRWHSPLHDSGIMKEVTGHRFAVVLESDDPAYSEEKARALFAKAGCQDIRPLLENADDGKWI